MKSYVCHKAVKAAQIVDITVDGEGASIVLDDGQSIRLQSEMIGRYIPRAGDYLIESADGYQSIILKPSFDNDYTPVYQDGAEFSSHSSVG